MAKNNVFYLNLSRRPPSSCGFNRCAHCNAQNFLLFTSGLIGAKFAKFFITYHIVSR